MSETENRFTLGSMVVGRPPGLPGWQSPKHSAGGSITAIDPYGVAMLSYSPGVTVAVSIAGAGVPLVRPPTSRHVFLAFPSYALI